MTAQGREDVTPSDAVGRTPAESRPGQDVFRKTVYVVHSRPTKQLTLVQKKLANAWLKHAVTFTPDQDGWWEIPIGLLREEINFPSTNTQYLKEAARALVQIAFEWDLLAPENKRIGWQTQVLFPAIAIVHGCIRFKISTDIYKELHRPEIYALIDMSIVRRLNSVAAMCIWEFCVRFENIGHTPSMPWQQFRDVVLGEQGEKKTLEQYKFMKLRVLSKAIKEINECSDHEIALVEKTAGRRVAAIHFTVRRKNTGVPEGELAAQKAVARMIQLGLPRTEARRLASSHPLRALNGALEYTERRLADPSQPKIEQSAAYFRKALEQGYGAPVDMAETATAPGNNGKRKAERQFDIDEAFSQYRREQARDYFAQLEDDEKKELLRRYNEQQEHDRLRVKSRQTKIAETAFMNWLAKDTWGASSAEDKLKFSVELLARKQ
ncbi:replication initiation protein [Azohydromonas australica]|uniref:replication initiation protein n=1 Tax=Azohydromonas australica TaxID=364039 RepID=UPI000491A146|nr:replication initiation protein [Azohydromonas australica]